MSDVAIIVPAYNAAATLQATLESAVCQSGINEMLVIDDGSTDSTREIALSFGPDVRVLSVPNGGVSAARNLGIAETSSEWIVFLDADDLLFPGTIARRLVTAKETNADVVVCDWQDLVDDGEGGLRTAELHSLDWEAMSEDAVIATATTEWATTAALMYHRTVSGKVGGFRLDLPIIQDARYFFDAASKGARFGHSPHVGAGYRIMMESLSRKNPARFHLDVLRNGEQIEALWRARGELSAAQRRALCDIYNGAAGGLFSVEHDSFFEAIGALERLDGKLTRHNLIASRLVRAIGPRASRRIVDAILLFRRMGQRQLGHVDSLSGPAK
ncbi:MAG: glycosyltransferase [Pseudomonadota bacterium]